MERVMKKNEREMEIKEEEGKSKRKLPRVEKRRQRIRKQIIEIATRRFALEGPDNVRLEEVADEVDISRATLYSHFPSKDAIVVEIIRPVLEDLIQKYELLLKNMDSYSVSDVMERLSEIYIHLWESHELALMLAQKVLDMDPGELQPLYDRMLELKLGILAHLEEEKKLRLPKEVAFQLMLNCIIPMLRYILPIENGKELFKKTLEGMLISQL